MKIKKYLLLITACFCLAIGAGAMGARSAVTASVAHASGATVYLGGTPLGIVTETDGVIIDNYINVNTKDGPSCPAKDAGLMAGDVIVKIGQTKITKPADILQALENLKDGPATIEIRRNGELKILEITPKTDVALSTKKIGVMVKNDISGVGTLTYVKANNMRFGALGHPICDQKGSNSYKNGNIYPCNIIGSIKGQSGKAGELRGTFNRTEKSIGKIDGNCFSGLFGTATRSMVENRPLIEVANRSEVRTGIAHIYTTVSGKNPEMYEIEILKAEEQSSPSPKSMLLKITDGRLKDATGGIVQGMSGSPIVQNGKLIGAVTHVLVNDPAKGFGIYIDWMLDK